MYGSEHGVPTFRPSPKDCEGSWEAYITKIEPKFKKVGICKIIPPKTWKPCKDGEMEQREFTLQRPIEQTVTGKQGFFQALQLVRKQMSLQEEFGPLAKKSCNQPKGTIAEDVEREFWRSTHLHPPIYGADCEATLCDDDTSAWNIAHLDSLLSRVLKEKLPGVNTSYLYFGMWRTFFGWHSEDMDLHSVNYLHYGAPKHWYCIPPEHSERFEAWVKGMVPDCFRQCSEFFRHKELLISPSRLKAASIPFTKMVQYPGEMVINYPGAYHSGFNAGFNCAESTNFATKTWIKHGAQADCCTCRVDTVNIDMRIFLPYADRATKKVIAENFVSDTESSSESDSEQPSTSDSDDEHCSPQKSRRQAGSTLSRHLDSPHARQLDSPCARKGAPPLATKQPQKRKAGACDPAERPHQRPKGREMTPMVEFLGPPAGPAKSLWDGQVLVTHKELSRSASNCTGHFLRLGTTRDHVPTEQRGEQDGCA